MLPDPVHCSKATSLSVLLDAYQRAHSCAWKTLLASWIFGEPWMGTEHCAHAPLAMTGQYCIITGGQTDK